MQSLTRVINDAVRTNTRDGCCCRPRKSLHLFLDLGHILDSAGSTPVVSTTFRVFSQEEMNFGNDLQAKHDLFFHRSTTSMTTSKGQHLWKHI